MYICECVCVSEFVSVCTYVSVVYVCVCACVHACVYKSYYVT